MLAACLLFLYMHVVHVYKRVHTYAIGIGPGYSLLCHDGVSLSSVALQ
jgi:hypothetical protein